ncbi:MAG: type VI secretion system lipoprotein TssJ [Rhodocyclaceae bacterium]
MHQRQRRTLSSLTRLLGTLLLPAMLLGGCSLFSKAPTTTQITVQADNEVNVDSRKRATPVAVRVYLLRNTTAFSTSDFFSLWEKEQQTLAESMQWREELMLKPGESRVLDKRDPADAKFIAVVAAFRNIDKASWRTSEVLIPNKLNKIVISAVGDKVSITVAKD